MTERHGLSPEVLALRAMRKTAHLSNKAIAFGGRVMGKVERTLSTLIDSENGVGRRSQTVDQLMLLYHLRAAPAYPMLPKLGQRPSVTVFGSLYSKGFFGGMATLLRLAARLALELDFDLRVVQTTVLGKEANLVKFLADEKIDFPMSRISTVDLVTTRELPLHPRDIVMVSAWWDARAAARLPLDHPFVYLIQDYEPIFYGFGDEYVWADETYRATNFVPVINTHVLAEYFTQHKYQQVATDPVVLEPAVGLRLLADRPRQRRQDARTLFLYGRASVPRNLYYSALQAIDMALLDDRVAGLNWRVYSAGQDGLEDTRFYGGATLRNLGKLSLDQYHQFARTVDITLSPMMSPHPNYPTLEMASLGGMVVTTKWDTKTDLGFYSPNILMADVTPESMAEQIIAAALTSDEARAEGLANTRIANDWRAALAEPVAELARRLRS